MRASAANPLVSLRFSYFFFLIGLLSGCGQQADFRSIHTFEQQAWILADSITFQFENTDTARHRKLQLGIRITENYPFMNLWLTSTVLTPSGRKITSTPELFFADSLGIWVAEKTAGLYPYAFTVNPDLILNEKGVYRFIFKHFMRPDTLPGIASFEFKLLPAEN
jgi:gliding motility-associated lipoprotein GldH